MDQHPGLIGRSQEQQELRSALQAARNGEGQLLLLSGEAGVGKTRLVEETLASEADSYLRGSAIEETTLPYGPIITVLRAFLRNQQGDFAACGALAHHLNFLLPELGPTPESGDQATLYEAICCAVTAIAASQPVVIFLDDLQWADNATLELLPFLADALGQHPVLIIGAYRSDEIPRGHPVRRLRHILRRARRLHELVISSLDEEGTGRLASQVLSQPVTPSLAALLYRQTEGIPLLVEELTLALQSNDRLQQTPDGLQLLRESDLPIPETIRDAVLLRMDGLSEAGRKLLEAAAVSGLDFDLDLALRLVGSDAGFPELLERNLIIETEPGQGAFRHALTREAVYGEIIWTQRRRLHREFAARLEMTGASPKLIAEHWLAGRELERARRALLAAVTNFCDVHAYRDAMQTAERALEIWPDEEEEGQRLKLLDRLAQCAQLCGQLNDAVRAWREASDGWRQRGDHVEFAGSQRCLATVHELQGAWGQAIAVRQAAAAAYAKAMQPSEAASERLAIAAHWQGRARYADALPVVEAAIQEAEQAECTDLLARGLALKGLILAKSGEVAAGCQLAQDALSLALRQNLIGAAAEVYLRLASAWEQTADYSSAAALYDEAIHYCQQHDASTFQHFCMACAAGVFWQAGDWERARNLCQDVLEQNDSPPRVRAVATGYLGIIEVTRGQVKGARVLLDKALAQAHRNEVATLELLCLWGLALAHEFEGAYGAAAEQYRYLLERWEETEERHYVVPALRNAATFFGVQDELPGPAACAESLASIAAAKGNREAAAALAHALGEAALQDDQPNQAVEQFQQALAMLHGVDAPHQRAETEWRAGLAFAAAGQREAGVNHLVSAYRTARQLGAEPLATRALKGLTRLGESVEERVSRRAAGRLKRGGLTRRQFQVLQYVATGMTNREIADELVLSPRTVEMHISNILTRLDCRTRAEAVHRAGEMGLLEETIGN